MSQRPVQDYVYSGFEQGPIRPPSEAHSLLLRVTCNCPWNRCTFCPVYKGARFSIRPVDHVKRDIDAVYRQVASLRELAGPSGRLGRGDARRAAGAVAPEDTAAFVAALPWFVAGMSAVFLQDANSLVIRPADLVEILEHLQMRFPWPKRITSYARSHTLARMKEEDLRALRQAGLNRLHVGLESGSDRVLALVDKGATQAMHVAAGRKVKQAGIELSEYIMPGLGGKTLSREHALETAAALNRIDPDFVRLRPLAVSERAPLFAECQAGRFIPCTDLEIVQELLVLFEHLEGISSTVQSDHILNLFADLEGTLPGDRDRMLGVLRAFLVLPPEEQRLYQLGRRLGLFVGLADLEDPHRRAQVEQASRILEVTAGNIDEIMGELMRRFI